MTSRPYAVVKKDLWSFVGQVDAVCVTTNGFVTKAGRAVMGRGVAAQARERYQDVDIVLASCLQEEGNVPSILFENVSRNVRDHRTALVSFPTKVSKAKIAVEEDLLLVLPSYRQPEQLGTEVPGWMMYSNLKLIGQSAQLLSKMASANEWESVVLPVPGCGNGGLAEQDVHLVLQEYLDGRFLLVH
jgi:hypothetical protein